MKKIRIFSFPSHSPGEHVSGVDYPRVIQPMKFLDGYNDGEYNEWKETVANGINGWKIKYYKGLGTSTGKEFKEYFEHKKRMQYTLSYSPSSFQPYLLSCSSCCKTRMLSIIFSNTDPSHQHLLIEVQGKHRKQHFF